jgi:catechol 2,3-dioxygenase-like lactoylglutathione lyase family enzyme
MAAVLDHLILQVNDLEESIGFYEGVLGFNYEGRREPFAVLRVNAELVLQLAAWGSEGGDHLAFALPPADFDPAFERIRAAGLPYGDAFDAVGNMKGPGRESGARGDGLAVYFMDPNRHLLEIRCYEES